MASFEVIRKPVITEKTTLLQEQNKYVFEVDPRASKAEVKQAAKPPRTNARSPRLDTANDASSSPAQLSH